MDVTYYPTIIQAHFTNDQCEIRYMSTLQFDQSLSSSDEESSTFNFEIRFMLQK